MCVCVCVSVHYKLMSERVREREKERDREREREREGGVEKCKLGGNCFLYNSNYYCTLQCMHAVVYQIDRNLTTATL